VWVDVGPFGDLSRIDGGNRSAVRCGILPAIDVGAIPLCSKYRPRCMATTGVGSLRVYFVALLRKNIVDHPALARCLSVLHLALQGGCLCWFVDRLQAINFKSGSSKAGFVPVSGESIVLLTPRLELLNPVCGEPFFTLTGTGEPLRISRPFLRTIQKNKEIIR